MIRIRWTGVGPRARSYKTVATTGHGAHMTAIFECACICSVAIVVSCGGRAVYDEGPARSQGGGRSSGGAEALGVGGSAVATGAGGRPGSGGNGTSSNANGGGNGSDQSTYEICRAFCKGSLGACSFSLPDYELDRCMVGCIPSIDDAPPQCQSSIREATRCIGKALTLTGRITCEERSRIVEEKCGSLTSVIKCD